MLFRSAASFASKYEKGSTKDYWKGNAPVLEKCDYNGESVMLPKIAPRDEPQVTVRKVILDRTISTIENHQGGTKVNWFWKMQMLNNRFIDVIPALAVTAKQLLPTIKTLTTLNLYTYTDATLYGNTVQQELEINDLANANMVRADSRAACRWIGLTMTFEPQGIIPQGDMIDAAKLPAGSSLRVYLRAPANAGGGLLNAISKAMLVNTPEQIFQ